jgi:glutamyl/glutaminyl-tRNA synthetase
MNKNGTVITRFPPSPTGVLHVGSVRTALYNYIFARQNNGKFIIRIEDTDRERSKPEFETNIIKGLQWLGLSHDNEKIIRQSEQASTYETYLKKIVDSGHAYISKEAVKEEGQRSEVIRFKNPNKIITFTDLVRGDITFDTTELGDFVIAKSLSEPLYHVAVVVDDHEAGVTHVIRGEDGISNTPRQILIQEAIGASRPIYAHLPLILDAERAKLSKRKHGEKVALDYYVSKGYLKEAILNYLALLGWNPGTEQEIFSLDELVKLFDLAKVQKGGAIFNEEKLKWINKEHVAKLSDDEFNTLARAFIPADLTFDEATLLKILKTCKERISTLGEN